MATCCGFIRCRHHHRPGAVRPHLQGWQADRHRSGDGHSRPAQAVPAGHVAVNVVLDDSELAGDPDLVAIGVAEADASGETWKT